MSIQYFIPLTKADEATREVWGIAAVEEPDAHREILDYELSKPNFLAWSERMSQATAGKSKGNVRAMHKGALAAVGKVIHFEALDDKKAFYVGTKIVDDEAWNKVVEGVYTGFSVGGRYGKRFPDAMLKGYTRYEALPSELSLVDVPAAPDARFEMVKADGMIEMRKFATLHKSESLDELTNKVRSAFDEQFNRPAAETETVTPNHAWVIDVQTDQVIVEQGADGFFAYPYSVDTEGNVTFGAPSAVERQYVLKKGANMDKLQEILSQMESSDSEDVKSLAAQLKAALADEENFEGKDQPPAEDSPTGKQEEQETNPNSEAGAAPEGQGLSTEAVKEIVISLLVDLGLVQRQGEVVKYDGANLQTELQSLSKGLSAVDGAIAEQVGIVLKRVEPLEDLQKSFTELQSTLENHQKSIIADLARVAAGAETLNTRLEVIEKRGESGPILREVPMLPADGQTLETLKKLAEQAPNAGIRQHIQAEIARLSIKAAQNNPVQ